MSKVYMMVTITNRNKRKDFRTEAGKTEGLGEVLQGKIIIIKKVMNYGKSISNLYQ